MTRDVHRLIVDYLRRVPWGAWLMIAVVHGQATFSNFLDMSSRLQSLGPLGWFILMTFMQNRAWLGVSSSLPVIRRDIWRAQWWIGLVVPGLMFTALDGLIVLGTQRLAHSRVDIWHVALWMTNTWATLGVLLLVLKSLSLAVGALSKISQSLRWMPIIIYLGYFYMLSTGWPMHAPWLAATLVMFVIGLASAIVAYVWPDLLAPLSLATAAAPAHASIMSASSRSGWAVLGRMHVYATLAYASLVGASVLALRLAGIFPGHAFLMVVFMVGATTSFGPWMLLPLSAVRTFRSLPLTIDRLTALAELAGLLPAALMMMVALAAGGLSLSDLGSVLPLALTMLAVQTLIVPIRLRMGDSRAAIVFNGLFIGLFSGALSLVSTMKLSEEPWWLSASHGSLSAGYALSAVIATMGFLWARHELGSRNAYVHTSVLVAASFSAGPGTHSA